MVHSKLIRCAGLVLVTTALSTAAVAGIRTVWAGSTPELPEIFHDDFESGDTTA